MSTPERTLATDLRITLGQLSRRLREQSHPGDFTASQKSVLHRLEREGSTTATALARAEGVRPQSMGATLQTLQTAGLIHATPDPADGRRTLLSLTPRCRRMILSSRAIREDWLHRALETNFTSRERQSLAAAVQLLKRLAIA